MIDYRLVPVDPTPEMVEAAEDAYMPFGDMAMAIRMALLAAPAVQGEPVDDSLTPVPDELFAAEFNAWWEQHGQFCRAGGGDYERTFAFEAWRHLYPKLMNLQMAAAEQQPLTSSLAYDASIHLTNWLNMNLCECEGGHTCGYTEVRRTRDALLAVAEQQPDVAQLVEHHSPSSYPVSGSVCFRESTGEWVLEITASINGAKITARHTQPAGTRPEDVVGLPALYESTPAITPLVEALESLIKGYVGLLEAGMDRITSLGGDCDPVPVMEQNDPWLRDARAALAAHRKQQEGEA